MTPTSWTELTSPAPAWQEGIPTLGVPEDDFFIDFLFEGTLFFNPASTYVEFTAPATVHTELTAPAASWTELTG